MKLNCVNLTFWFNIYEEHSKILNSFLKELNPEFQKFDINNQTNLFAPVVVGENNVEETKITMSYINLQYTMENVNIEDLPTFKNRVLKLFEILKNNNIEILHTSLFSNSEILSKSALEKMIKNIFKSSIRTSNLNDSMIRLVKTEEDLFYKIITLEHKKQITLQKKIDEKGRIVPIPLLSFCKANIENESIEISYELNDKYSFDTEEYYHTAEFYLTKMLYLFENNFKEDINNLLEKGRF